MTPFTRFDLPGHLTELSESAGDAWSAEMVEHTAQFAFVFTRYFDPTSQGAPAQPRQISIVWSASPARLLGSLTDRERWELADGSRDQQDEYCEWQVDRNDDGEMTKVTFSTEVPEYWSHVAATDPDKLLALYKGLVDARAEMSDLFAADGTYLRDNVWNNATSDGIAHLRQGSNTLLAALRLAAESTVQRVGPTGERVTDRRQLVVCGKLGEPLRNSDPQIADVVNDAVAAGSAVTLANPLGLYLDGLQAAGFRAPDGADVSTFWTVERGTTRHAMRATFEVPDGHDYVLGNLMLDGRPLQFGTQVADKVRVRIDALLSQGLATADTKPCET